MSLVSNCVRYVDVAAGLGLLVSQSCLVWGVRAGGRIHQVRIVMKIVMKMTVKMLTPSPGARLLPAEHAGAAGLLGLVGRALLLQDGDRGQPGGDHLLHTPMQNTP